jgi:16S rRNA (cytosine967-C5)-methyltransferase
MTPGGRLDAIIELLHGVYETQRPADATLSAYFRQRRYIGSKDRAFISEKVYAALRHHARLGWWIEREQGTVTPRTRALANAILADRQSASTIEDLFSGQFGPIPLSIYERELIHRLDTHTLEHPQMPEIVRVECPAWAEEGLRAALGRDFVRELEGLIPSARIDLRVNPLLITREEAIAELSAAGIVGQPTPFSPLGIRIVGRPPIMAQPLYKNGALEIQDEGSQLVALMADARPGFAVMDYCAGAGGKTLAMAAAMGNKGRIVASDVLDGRLERAKERFRRAGLQNVETRALDGDMKSWLKRRKASFDRVLVDAPCSGTGTWRRNPDMRWRPLGPGLSELTKLQGEILGQAASLVKPGGRLVYATCSLLREENEAIVEAFLGAHPEFVVKPASQVWQEVLGSMPPGAGDYMRLSPARHGCDGFFTAVLHRQVKEQ